MRGIIVTWHGDRNFGFASVEGEDADAFVHLADSDEPLGVGDEIEGVVLRTPRGPRLVMVHRVKAGQLGLGQGG